MADMEDLGLIEQPHASAGRQPTERGFRVWVDQLMPQEPLSEQERSTSTRCYRTPAAKTSSS
jgi:heat-inducible transcriptional repressor